MSAEKREEPLDLRVGQEWSQYASLTQRKIPNFSPPPYSRYPPPRRGSIQPPASEWSCQQTTHPPAPLYIASVGSPMTRHASCKRTIIFSPPQINNHSAQQPLPPVVSLPKTYCLYQPLMVDERIVTIFSARLLAIQRTCYNRQNIAAPHSANNIRRQCPPEAHPSPPIATSAPTQPGFTLQPGPVRGPSPIHSHYVFVQNQVNTILDQRFERFQQQLLSCPQRNESFESDDQQADDIPFENGQSLPTTQREHLAESQTGGGYMRSCNTGTSRRTRPRQTVERTSGTAQDNVNSQEPPARMQLGAEKETKPVRRVIAVRTTVQLPQLGSIAEKREVLPAKEQAEMPQQEVVQRRRSRRDSLWDLVADIPDSLIRSDPEEPEKKKTVSDHVRSALENHIKNRKLPMLEASRGCHDGYINTELLEMVAPNPMFLEDDTFHPDWPLQKMLDAWESKVPIPVRTKEPWKDFIDELFHEVEDDIQQARA